MPHPDEYASKCVCPTRMPEHGSDAMDHFDAFRIHHEELTGHQAGLTRLDTASLTPGEVLVQVTYSSVNYKDALAGTGTGRILRRYPLNGGIDLAGHVVASTDPAVKEGDAVLCTGSGLSETRDGGYARYARLDATCTIPLPTGLSLRESMILGTAGFTAALSLLRMQSNQQTPDSGPIAITGASGGVGQLAIDIYSRVGYEVYAISGKTSHFQDLCALGAAQCLNRHTLTASGKPMDSVRFGGVLDNVGGAILSALLPQVAPRGNVAVCGNAGGIGLGTTLMPFIIRGVNMLGIASASAPRELREEVWRRLANAWKPRHLERITTREITLAELPEVFAHMLSGQSFGRTLVCLEKH